MVSNDHFIVSCVRAPVSCVCPPAFCTISSGFAVFIPLGAAGEWGMVGGKLGCALISLNDLIMLTNINLKVVCIISPCGIGQ